MNLSANVNRKPYQQNGNAPVIPEKYSSHTLNNGIEPETFDRPHQSEPYLLPEQPFPGQDIKSVVCGDRNGST